MKKLFILPALAILAASCKEVPVTVDMGSVPYSDTTYVSSTIEAPETKNFLVEEVTGVRCVNCPLGTEKLNELNAQNNNRLHVIAVHQSSFSNPYDENKYDFTTGDDGKSIIQGIFGSQGNPPTACFDRWPLGNNSEYLVDGQTNFAAAVAEMKALSNTTPVNLSVQSNYNAQRDEYEIDVTIRYTENVTGQHGLTIYLTENDIEDVQLTPDGKDFNYIFNHVFRKAILPAAGKIILSDLETKEAGRVYNCRTILKIDASDSFQSNWKPENLEVTAFLSVANNPDDKHVLQVQTVPLIP